MMKMKTLLKIMIDGHEEDIGDDDDNDDDNDDDDDDVLGDDGVERGPLRI